jgi:hypothetical protein
LIELLDHPVVQHLRIVHDLAASKHWCAGHIGRIETIQPILAADGVVVCESSAGQPMEVGLPLQRERRYGDTLVRFHGTK